LHASIIRYTQHRW